MHVITVGVAALSLSAALLAPSAALHAQERSAEAVDREPAHSATAVEPGAVAPVEPHDAFAVSLYAGAGSHRGWNYAGVTVEWFPARQDHVSLFGTAGIGTILLGGGAAYYTDRDGHGIIASVSAGIVGAHANLAGQLRLGEFGYLVGGIGAGTYFLAHTGVLPFLSYEYRFE